MVSARSGRATPRTRASRMRESSRVVSRSAVPRSWDRKGKCMKRTWSYRTSIGTESIGWLRPRRAVLVPSGLSCRLLRVGFGDCRLVGGAGGFLTDPSLLELGQECDPEQASVLIVGFEKELEKFPGNRSLGRDLPFRENGERVLRPARTQELEDQGLEFIGSLILEEVQDDFDGRTFEERL